MHRTMSVLIEYFLASCLKRIICKVYFYMFATVECVDPRIIFKTTSLLVIIGKEPSNVPREFVPDTVVRHHLIDEVLKTCICIYI